MPDPTALFARYSRWPLAVLVAALAAGACSESERGEVQTAADKGDSTSTQATTTSRSDADALLPTESASTGSYEVGVDEVSNAEVSGVPPSDEEADVFVPLECPGLGYDYTLGCDNCPSTTITCPCRPYGEASGEVTSFQLGCSFGTCFVHVSCDVWCDAAVERSADAFFSTFTCPSERTCAAQSDCGGGHCYGETADARGSCIAGADGDDCLDASDCQGGFCGPRGCSDGKPDARCVTESDCAAGKCTMHAEYDVVGWCTTGAHNEKCYSDDDCAPELFCHTGATRCFYLNGGTCQTGEHCESGRCAFGRCVTGELGGECVENEHCDSGHCLRPELPTGVRIFGSCISGAAGEVCYFDDDCESGHCLSVEHNVEGICTDRALGDPCLVSADCESGSCTERSQQASSDCERATDAGVVCEGGLCIDGATCSALTCD